MSGYHQLQVRAEDNFETAFPTRYKHDEFLVMPFSLMNAPAVFIDYVKYVFRQYLDQIVVVLWDGVIVYSRSLEEYKEASENFINWLERKIFIC